MPGGLTNTRNKEEGSDGDWIIAPPVPSLSKWLQPLQIERQLAKGVANKVHRWGHVPKCKFVSKLGVAVDLANPWMHSTTGEPTRCWDLFRFRYRRHYKNQSQVPPGCSSCPRPHRNRLPKTWSSSASTCRSLQGNTQGATSILDG